MTDDFDIAGFIETIGIDATDTLLELLEIGELRMCADLDGADAEDVDYELARLRLGNAMNDWTHGQLTLALLDGYGLIVHDGCRDCFRLSERGCAVLEFLRGVMVEDDGEEPSGEDERKRLN